MWTYNTNELYHFGVKGMKWGVRRAEKRAARKAAKAERRAAAEKERAEIKKNVLPIDSYTYGELGARRIARDMVKNGKTREEARSNELKRQVGSFVATTAVAVIGNVIAINLENGNLQSMCRKGKSAAKSFVDSRYNSSILDANGKVIKRFNMNFSTPKSSGNSLIPFR